jgi:hypothetical protein
VGFENINAFTTLYPDQSYNARRWNPVQWRLQSTMGLLQPSCRGES